MQQQTSLFLRICINQTGKTTFDCMWSSCTTITVVINILCRPQIVISWGFFIEKEDIHQSCYGLLVPLQYKYQKYVGAYTTIHGSRCICFIFLIFWILLILFLPLGFPVYIVKCVFIYSFMLIFIS